MLPLEFPGPPQPQKALEQRHFRREIYYPVFQIPLARRFWPHDGNHHSPQEGVNPCTGWLIPVRDGLGIVQNVNILTGDSCGVFQNTASERSSDPYGFQGSSPGHAQLPLTTQLLGSTRLLQRCSRNACAPRTGRKFPWISASLALCPADTIKTVAKWFTDLFLGHICSGLSQAASAASLTASASVGWACEARPRSSALAPKAMATAASAIRSPAWAPRM